MENHIPVLIVGAGPTGLTAAIQLQRYGIPFRIIDKNIKPVPTSNALGVQTRTIEVWNDLGILDRALELGNKIRGMQIYSKNKKIATVDLTAIKHAYPFLLGLPQRQTETIMIEDLHQKNISIELETEIVDVQENENSVVVTLKKKNGESETVKADWLIACDGGRSFVREKLNIPFVGHELSQHFVLADAEITSDLPNNWVSIFTSGVGQFILIKFDDKYTRIIAEVSNVPELKEAKSLTYEQVLELAKTRCPIKLEIKKPIWTSGFWIHEKIIEKYRSNKVFFAGDAAHVHSPAGGQGMNTGIQDAYNLAWKLALVINNKAKPTILETYETERRPVALAVLKSTTMMTKMVSLHNRFLIALRNWILSIVLKSKAIQEKFVDTVSQLKIQYEPDMLVKECLHDHPGPAAGTVMLDLKLLDLARGTDFVLLLFSGTKKDFTMDELCHIKENLSRRYPGLIKFILINSQSERSVWSGEFVFDADLKMHETYGVTDPTLYLIRPDKYIGFRGHLEHIPELEKYLAFLN